MIGEFWGNRAVNRRAFLGRCSAVMGGLLAGIQARPLTAAAQDQSEPPASLAGNRTPTLIQFAEFAHATSFNDLPESVVRETKRLLLDSIGCALAGVHSEKGKWGIDYVRTYFSGPSQATAIGFGDRLSVPGAAFVNAELVNGLDWDLTSFNGPGHVAPFVIPPILAVGEQKKVSGKQFIVACALAHELTERLGDSLSNPPPQGADATRKPAPVSGCSVVVFGGTAGVCSIQQFSPDQLAQAMGLAGHMAPMQAAQTMLNDMPPTTAKYLMAGWAAQAQLSAAHLIKAGHRGDVTILDRTWGFPAFAGFGKWNAAKALDGLGKDWRFDKTTRYKAYPACGIMRGALDCLSTILKKNNLRPEEIESLHAYIEPSSTLPIFQSQNIEHQVDAQFSVPYNMSVMVHGVSLRDWQAKETMRNPEIRQFMKKVTFGPHPHYNDAMQKDARAHLEKVEIVARGQTFVEERPYFKGSPSPDPSTAMTDDDLISKYKVGAGQILPEAKSNEAARQLMDLDGVHDISTLMQLLHA